MKETELAKYIIDHLTHPKNEIYKEVQCFGCITDFVIKRGEDIISVETKTTFGLAVLSQAHRNLKYYNYCYIGVPYCKPTFALQVAKDYGIGVIAVNTKGKNEVWEQLKPKYNPNPTKPKLRDWMKQNEAGTQSDRLTSFKVFVASVEEQLLCNGPMNPRDLYRCSYRHYTNAAFMKSNLIQHIKSGLIKTVEYKSGKFTLI